jgi:signal transduction histidine kinase/ligand-binding sensor domain-containing protein/DNA-binding response OmpR family regulator
MLGRFVLRQSILLFWFMSTALGHAYAQVGINFTSLTTKDGLSSNTVNAIHKDRYGLMWFGTADGLNKFDGTNFTVYRHDAKDNTSIPKNEVLSLYEDKEGRLWIGTSGGGLSYYDRQLNSFVQYRGDGSWKNAANITAKAFCEDNLGNLWVATYGGIRKINLKTNQISEPYLRPNPFHAEIVVLCLFQDSRHRMWVGTNKGLFLYNDKKNTFKQFDHNEADRTSLSSSIVKAISEDHKGNLWFATFDGLNLLMPDEKSFRVFKSDENSAGSLSNNLVYTVKPYDNDHLWIGTEDGLSVLNTKTFKFTALKPNPRNTFSLTNKSVRCIYFDKEGISWVGTFQGGVNKHDNNLVLFNLVKSDPFDKQGLTAPIVSSFSEYNKDRIFVGTDGGGLHLFNRGSGLFTHFDIKPAGARSGNLSILALQLDRTGKLWIGTFQNGLFWLDPHSGKYQQFMAGNTRASINQNDIFCIKEDSKGNVWVGTNGKGVNVYDPVNHIFNRFSQYPKEKGDLELPLNGFMRSIAEDAAGNVWLGSSGSGIAVFHPGSRTFSVYNKANSDLADDGVLTIFHDSHQTTWVGTNGGGMCRYNVRSHRFISYSEKDGLANGIVYKILEDKAGILWLSTDKGISSFNPKTHQFKNFTKHNGLQDGPFVRGAALRLSNGEMFFGGQDGFNYFEPTSLPANRAIPVVLLTDLKVANNTVVPGDESPLKAQIGVARDIRLAYGQNFSISYVALNYTTPQQNQYSYKLAGFDKEWNYVGNGTTAYYTNLDPGSYVFHVRASNNEGSWNNKETTIKIEVMPPLWRTIYAYAFYLLLSIGLLFYIRNRGIKKIKAEFAVRQEKEHARQLLDQERREAERLHDLDLLKIKFLTNLSHEFRTPISLILAPADKLLAMQRDDATSGQVNMIRRNAKRLLNLVNQLLDFRKMEEHELKLNLSPGDLIAFIREAADAFKDLSERKKIELLVISELESLSATFDRDKIERVIFNLLSNAFKFTHQGGRITLDLSWSEDGEKQQNLCLKIVDTGIGIPDEFHDMIFQRFFQHDSPDSILNQGSGIGLSITKEFVELHGGEITVSSKPGQGSVFTINLPIMPVNLKIVDTDIPGAGDIQAGPEDNSEPDFNAAAVQTSIATVLLVEDNDEFRFYLKDNLKAYYQIVEASHGKEGWQKTLSCHPQLVVSDISMPYMNGIELSKKIKSDKRTSHIPVILLTAISGEKDQISGLESGANDYLTKPFNFEILNAKIKNLLVYNRTLKDAYSKQIHVVGQEVVIESADAKLLNVIVSYIEEKLNDPELSVEDLSKHVGMSRGSLYHKLLELTGLSPIEYIRSVKLDRAAALLEKSDYNVAQIAYMTGFGTPSYFSRMFKVKFNQLPSEYMNTKRKDSKTRLDASNSNQAESNEG